jgi:hypothetical protein
MRESFEKNQRQSEMDAYVNSGQNPKVLSVLTKPRVASHDEYSGLDAARKRKHKMDKSSKKTCTSSGFQINSNTPNVQS